MEVLPEDALSSIASFFVINLPGPRRQWQHWKGRTDNGLAERYQQKLERVRCRTDVLSLRCASTSWRKSVWEALKARESKSPVDWKMNFGIHNISIPRDVPVDPDASARTIWAIGKVYGVSISYLTFNSRSFEVHESLSSFVASTSGSLQIITISQSSISASRLLDMCRASPHLKRLSLGAALPRIHRAWVDIAARVSLACPSITSLNVEVAHSVPAHLSVCTTGAESWEMHFPHLERITFGTDPNDRGRGPLHTPVKYRGIEATARRCVNAETCEFYSCVVRQRLIECILSTPLHSRLKSVSFSDCDFDEAAILLLAAGCPALRFLDVGYPQGHDMWAVDNSTICGPEFYVSLLDARPELTDLSYPSEGFDNACLEAICRFSHLDELGLHSRRQLNWDLVVETIVSHPCSQSLEKVYAWGPEMFSAADLLRLVQCCPKMREFTCNANDALYAYWDEEEWEDDSDRDFYIEIIIAKNILEDRGGSLTVQWPESSENYWLA